MNSFQGSNLPLWWRQTGRQEAEDGLTPFGLSYYSKNLLIEEWLIYLIVLVSGVQLSDSIMHI